MVIFNDFTWFLDKVAQIPQEMAGDNKEALDRLEMQNQKFLGAQREIDASLCRACVMFCRRFGPRPKVSCVIFLNT